MDAHLLPAAPARAHPLCSAQPQTQPERHMLSGTEAYIRYTARSLIPLKRLHPHQALVGQRQRGRSLHGVGTQRLEFLDSFGTTAPTWSVRAECPVRAASYAIHWPAVPSLEPSMTSFGTSRQRARRSCPASCKLSAAFTYLATRPTRTHLRSDAAKNC